MKKILSLVILLILLCSYYIIVPAAEIPAIYVCDGGNGNGSSGSPIGTLERAYELLFERSNVGKDAEASAVIVICGPLTIDDHFNYDGKIIHEGTVILTSFFAGTDYRETADARLVIHADSKDSLSVHDEQRFSVGGPTRFENLILDRGGKTSVALTIYAGTDFYAAKSFEVVNTNWCRSYSEPVRALGADEIESILLSAHRGFQPQGPENSVLAFEAAGRLGFDYIETDVRMTSDGELVCLHDATVDRTTNGEGDISEISYSELTKFRIDTAAYGFNISSADKDKLYVPTFREYLEICRKYGSRPFIELKSGSEMYLEKTINIALEYFAPEDIVISSGSLSLLELSHDINSDIFCHLIWGDQSDKGYENSISRLAKMTDKNGEVNAGIAFNITGLTDKSNYERAEKWINKAHSAGLLACLRGADDPEELRLMFELGVDYYPTNVTSPEKLSSLSEARAGGYSYCASDGGKLFIRGGRRSETTKIDISIVLEGGIFDFVAPSNAEAESIGSYSVTVGENAFVSRLVAGETAKNAAGDRSISVVNITGSAEVRELFIAGDYSKTENVCVNIFSGNVGSLLESRAKGGLAENFTLRIESLSLMPQIVSISDSAVILGGKRLEIGSGEDYADGIWSEIVNLAQESETEESVAVESVLLAETTEASDCKVETENAPDLRAVAFIGLAALFLLVFCLICFKKRLINNCETPR